ncbi:26S proteasome non-ATPase regulatory subunit 5-like [Paramacrobiotus metropolitanus]|uniref:26S proteasome non-ATPase regulatory subunit 5-like n=1 Tax=Paramacrobiotus metropolitanus TaxID=2943436 RepID=UPI002445CF2E|nr:26S proteasome non-ATPase regulatory subunit 5-like [Paramacrobiotus metropolitanus]
MQLVMDSNDSATQSSSRFGNTTSDVLLSALFSKICDIFAKAHTAADLQNLRKLLSDITYEITKYGTLSLLADIWKPKLHRFSNEILPRVQVAPTVAIHIQDVENDVANLIDVLTESLTDANGVKDVQINLPWHLEFAVLCTKVPALPRVRAFGYRKIGRLRNGLEISPENLSLFLPITSTSAEGFREDESYVAVAAETSILQICQHFHITNILRPNFHFAARIVDIVDKPTRGGSRDVVNFRIFDFLDKLLIQSADNLPYVVQLGLMEHLYKTFRNMDLLVLANASEIMCQFAQHSTGLQLLEESGGMDLAENTIMSKKNEREFEYFGPYLMRMYITLARKFPEYCILKCEKVILLAGQLVFDRTDHSAAAALEFFGQLASCSVAGKRYLHNLILSTGERLIDKLLKLLGRRVTSTSGKDSVTDNSIHVLELFVKRIEGLEPPTDSELQVISSLWFESMGDKVLMALFQKACNPFKDVKLPVLMVFRAMADQKWAQIKFREEPGLIEYLLNRQAEVDTDIKQLKFDVIESMVKSNSLTEVFDSVTVVRLKEYVRDGPFYMQGQYQVAFEGGA